MRVWYEALVNPKHAMLLIILFLPVALTTGQAQDRNYWNNQFGTRSALLSGAVVGSVRDSSAGFYNPAALGLMDDETVAVSANAFRYENGSLENGAGTGSDLDSEQVEIVPLLVSGVYFPSDCPCHVLGYSLLTRSSSNIDASARTDFVSDVISNPAFPGPENYLGSYSVSSDLDEYWAGLSYAHAPAESVSFGVSTFLAYRAQNLNAQTSARAVNQLQNAASDSSTFFDFYNLRLLWKAGSVVDLGSVKLGLTITTPSIDIHGRGSSARDTSVTNVDFDGDGIPGSFVASDRQDGLSAKYRNPLSVALGAEWELLEGTRVDGGLEWFGSVSRYNVLVPDSQDFIRPPGSAPSGVDSRDFLSISDAAKSVLNFAIGIEQELTDRIDLITSFRTDYSYARPYSGDGIGLGITDWNMYHVTLGSTYHRERSDVSLGVVYSFGDAQNFFQVANLSEPTEETFLFGRPRASTIDYDAVSIILGYTYHFE